MSTEKVTCGRFVAGQIARLVGPDPARQSPSSLAMLAQLRKASGAEPGSVPAIWSVTMEGIPELGPGDRERFETAVHMALTLFAIHQQARARSMHDKDQPFGTAVRRLAQRQAGMEGDPHVTPVYDRFVGLMSVPGQAGLVQRARGIITQLRGEEIAFNYARFADDLYRILDRANAPDVRRRWGREFSKLPTPSTTTAIEGE